jgi:hypothetical protein
VQNDFSKIIDSLSPQCISRNFRSENWPISSDFLCIGARRTEKTKIPNLFEYEGWYRFFNSETAGKVEPLRGGAHDPVRSDDDARVNIIGRAIGDILIPPCEEYAYDLGAIPHRLCIITAQSSLPAELDTLMKETDTESLSPFCRGLKEHLGWLNRLETCTVTQELVKQIRRL